MLQRLLALVDSLLGSRLYFVSSHIREDHTERVHCRYVVSSWAPLCLCEQSYALLYRLEFLAFLPFSTICRYARRKLSTCSLDSIQIRTQLAKTCY